MDILLIFSHFDELFDKSWWYATKNKPRKANSTNLEHLKNYNQCQLPFSFDSLQEAPRRRRAPLHHAPAETAQVLRRSSRADEEAAALPGGEFFHPKMAEGLETPQEIA